MPAGRSRSRRRSAYLAPFGAFVVSLGAAYPKIAEAYRTGHGVSFGEYGDVLREAQETLNRPAYENFLAGWVETGLPDVHERLTSGEQVRIADVGCGCGWSTITLGKTYPHAHVDGLDNDKASIEHARRNAAGAGADNVHFSTRNAADPALDGQYNLVGDPIERMMYSASAIHCLLVGRSEQPSAGTGAVLRTSTLVKYAAQAGLRVTVLPIEHDCWRFYRLDV